MGGVAHQPTRVQLTIDQVSYQWSQVLSIWWTLGVLAIVRALDDEV